MSGTKMSPVLKWAGGKLQLLEAIKSRMPESYNTYYEPFVGGGAVVLGVSPQKAVINDCNEQLINLYRQLKLNTRDLINLIIEYDSVDCDKDLYISMRKRYNEKILKNELDTESAALLIWVNKHCFNGLYRVNRKGLFNVPYNNRSSGKSVDSDNVINIGEYLNKAEIEICCGDFEVICQNSESGDFVYFDSPYAPVSDTADFTAYTKNGFSMSDHERLSQLFKVLDNRGVKLMLSNNDVPLIRELYKEYNIQPLTVKRMINCDASKRTGKEVLITNY